MSSVSRTSPIFLERVDGGNFFVVEMTYDEGSIDRWQALSNTSIWPCATHPRWWAVTLGDCAPYPWTSGVRPVALRPIFLDDLLFTRNLDGLYFMQMKCQRMKGELRKMGVNSYKIAKDFWGERYDIK